MPSSAPKKITIAHIQHPSFFDPPLLKIIKAIQGGASAVLPDDFSLKIKWPAVFQAKLRDLLTKGDLTSLPELLSVCPMAIAHPVIFGEIRHLAKMLRFMDTKEVQELQKDFGWTQVPSETILSPADKATAKALLASILDTAVSHLLLGYMVTKRPITRRSGRKPKHDAVFIRDCVFDFQSHCESLAKIFSIHARSIPTRKKIFWKPKKGETPKKFYARMGGILKDLNEASDLSIDIEMRIPKKAKPSPTKNAQSDFQPYFDGENSFTKKDWDELSQMRTAIKHIPLPANAISEMIQYAIRSKSTIDPRRLLYAFIAPWYHQTPEVIRGIIERYEGDCPKEAVELNLLLYGKPRW